MATDVASPLTTAECIDFEASEVTSVRPLSQSNGKVGPNDFELLKVIGVGAFGKVIQVREKPSRQIYAMKIVSKAYLTKRNSVAYMKSEREIMIKINHPFLIRLKYAFQTDQNVYLVMPFVAGGELFHHLTKNGLLLESTARFYAAEMVLALEHLHASGIIHRDLKPENILLGADGHICLTDFGLAKEIDLDKEDSSANTICGTNEYMAPEMIRNKSYNQAVDWWALGALIYEMVTGYPPYRHKNKKKLYQKILNEKLPLPKWLDSTTHSILKQLLERNVEKRLGSGKSTMFKIRGVQAIKQHPFFKDIDWDLLKRRQIQPPLIPELENECDTSNFDSAFTSMRLSESPTKAGEKQGDATEEDDEEQDPFERPRMFSTFSFTAEEFEVETEIQQETN